MRVKITILAGKRAPCLTLPNNKLVGKSTANWRLPDGSSKPGTA
jgi:hypothetical protein